MVFTVEARGKIAESMYDEWLLEEQQEIQEDAEFYEEDRNLDQDRVQYLVYMEKYMHRMRKDQEKNYYSSKCSPSQQLERKLKKEFKRLQRQCKKKENSFRTNKRNERSTTQQEQRENQDCEDCDDVLIKDAYFERMEREMCEWDEYLAVFGRSG